MNRHARLDRCPRCNAAYFDIKVGFTKPVIVCQNGCAEFSSGRDAEPYFGHAQNTKGKTWKDFVTHMWVKTQSGKDRLVETYTPEEQHWPEELKRDTPHD